ncbi:putative c6 finger domain [Diplodia seriata]|uniref:Putative c6 finger domain n=1 Tax=Diplodia seriata TaxID=420778 RepID=A0A0G2EFY3_9PEZI|nr:putative c6 finger domain [Diplodia seriata]
MSSAGGGGQASPASQRRGSETADATAAGTTKDNTKAKAAADSTNTKARKRTKTGCLTCRRRRIKCGEERPICNNCVKSKRQCEGYNQRVIFKPPIGDWPGSTPASTLPYHSGVIPGDRPVFQQPFPGPQSSGMPYGALQPGQQQYPLPQYGQFTGVDPFSGGQRTPTTQQAVPFQGGLQTSGFSAHHTSPTEALQEAAVEYEDDDYYDVHSDDEMELLPAQEQALAHGQQRDFELMMQIHQDSVNELNVRHYNTFLYSGILDHYRAEQVANPLRNPQTARVFAHFIHATGPSLSIFERRLQRASVTPSFKHYAYALKRVHHAVGHPKKRHHVTTLAACLMLGLYEVMTADHVKWTSHLLGAKQLFVEIDYAGMTKAWRKKKAEEDAFERNFAYENPGLTMQQPRYLNKEPSNLPDERVVSVLTGHQIRYDDFGKVFDDQGKDGGKAPEPDLTHYETYQDLWWWFVRHDGFQSAISGNGLLLDYTRCSSARYMPSAFKPENSPSPDPSVKLEDQAGLQAATQQALAEWQSIRDALSHYASHLGPAFAPLADEFTTPIPSPFGPALQYRSFDIAVLWSQYHMLEIILTRSHPSMPPAAMMAAGVAAQQTARLATDIGRIVAGIFSGLGPHGAPLNPSIGAALIECIMPLFFAGIQYVDPHQRDWLVVNVKDIEARTGWASAGLVANGCQKVWERAGLAGRGPRYDYRREDPDKNPDERISGRKEERAASEGRSLTQEEEEAAKQELSDRRYIWTNPGTRVHWAMGILSEEQDLIRPSGV